MLLKDLTFSLSDRLDIFIQQNDKLSQVKNLLEVNQNIHLPVLHLPKRVFFDLYNC